MTNAAMFQRMECRVRGATVAARGQILNAPAGVSVHLASGGEFARLEISGALLDGRVMGIQASLSKAELLKLQKMLRVAAERWADDQAR